MHITTSSLAVPMTAFLGVVILIGLVASSARTSIVSLFEPYARPKSRFASAFLTGITPGFLGAAAIAALGWFSLYPEYSAVSAIACAVGYHLRGMLDA